jgi:hypothetical protein
LRTSEEEEEEEEVPLTFWKVLGSRRYCSHQLLHHHHHHHHAASRMGMPTNNFKIYLSEDFIMMGILRISSLLQNVGAVHFPYSLEQQIHYFSTSSNSIRSMNSSKSREII